MNLKKPPAELESLMRRVSGRTAPDGTRKSLSKRIWESQGGTEYFDPTGIQALEAQCLNSGQKSMDKQSDSVLLSYQKELGPMFEDSEDGEMQSSQVNELDSDSFTESPRPTEDGLEDEFVDDSQPEELSLEIKVEESTQISVTGIDIKSDESSNTKHTSDTESGPKGSNAADDSKLDVESSSPDVNIDLDEYASVKARFLELIEQRDAWHIRIVHEHAQSKRKLERHRRRCTELENQLGDVTGKLSKERSEVKAVSDSRDQAVHARQELETELVGVRGELAVANGRLAQIAQVVSNSVHPSPRHD